VPGSGGLIGLLVGVYPRGFGVAITPAFLRTLGINLLQQNPPHKISRKPILSTALKTAKNTKCLDSASPTIILSISLLLTMCEATLLRLTRGQKFWLGYRHSNPRDGTTKSKPAESTRWETGSYRAKNIGIGLVVSMATDLVGQPCFAMEIQELARPTLGEREATRGKKDIANKPEC